jgi:hypothetical protein
LDHGFSTSADDWKHNLGIELIQSLVFLSSLRPASYALVAELDGPFEKSSPLLTPFQPCQWSDAFLSFYTFPTWCFSGFRTAYDGSVVCDCLCSTRLESCPDKPNSIDELEAGFLIASTQC